MWLSLKALPQRQPDYLVNNYPVAAIVFCFHKFRAGGPRQAPARLPLNWKRAKKAMLVTNKVWANTRDNKQVEKGGVVQRSHAMTLVEVTGNWWCGSIR